MRRLMHRREIVEQLKHARERMDHHTIARVPWWSPRAWLANRLAADFWRGQVEALRDVLNGHKKALPTVEQ